MGSPHLQPPALCWLSWVSALPDKPDARGLGSPPEAHSWAVSPLSLQCPLQAWWCPHITYFVHSDKDPSFPHHHPPGSCHGEAQRPDTQHLREVPAHLLSCRRLGHSLWEAQPLLCSIVMMPLPRSLVCPRGGRHRSGGRGREKAVASASLSFIEQTEVKTWICYWNEKRRTRAIELSQTHCKYQPPPPVPPPQSRLIWRFLLKK